MAQNLTRSQLNIVELAGNPESTQTMIFLDKVFVQASLPHSDPGDQEHWVRTNGDFVLRISPGEMTVDGITHRLGIPYGTFARLLLMWITTEALKNKSRRISLGRSLRKFLDSLGIASTGGKNGSITRLKEQLLRLIHCRVILENNSTTSTSGVQFYIVEQKSISWIEGKNSFNLKENIIDLNQNFYEHIISNSVPLDFDVIKAIKQSSFAIDLYVWLTYRVSYLKGSQFISWKALSQQMGGNYADINNFKKKFVSNLKTIKVIYSDLNIDQSYGGITIHPSSPHIKRLK